MAGIFNNHAPNFRYELARKKMRNKDPIVDRLLDGEKPLTELYEVSKELNHSLVKKAYIESCLICCPDLSKISDLLEIPVDVLSVYRDFFFNVKDYNKLALLELVGKADTQEEKNMKMWALSQGIEFIAWRLGKPVNISPIGGLQDLFTTSLYKSKEALFSANSSTSSIEAAKWTKLSMDLARLLKAWVLDSNEAKNDLQVALASISPEFQGYNDVLPSNDDSDENGLGESAADDLDASLKIASDLGLKEADLNDIPPLPKL